MGTIVNSLGLPVRQEGTLDDPPVIIVYGKLGVGKTTAVAQSFPDAYWICTHNTVLRGFETWMEEYPAQAASYGITKLPDRVVLPLVKKDGKTFLDPRPGIEAIQRTISQLIEKGTFPYSGVVFDEFSDLSLHISAITPRSEGWGGVDRVKEWHKNLVRWAREHGILLGLVCHETDPKTTERGIHYPGGPKLAIGTLREEIGALSDICVRLVAEEQQQSDGLASLLDSLKNGDDDSGASDVASSTHNPPSVAGTAQPAPSTNSDVNRYFVTQVRDDWVTKFRAFGISAKEAIGLRELLIRGRYPISHLRPATLMSR